MNKCVTVFGNYASNQLRLAEEITERKHRRILGR